MPGCSQLRLLGFTRQDEVHTLFPVVLVDDESLALGRQITRLAILDVVEKLYLGRHGEARLFALLIQSPEYRAADLLFQFVETAV